MIERPLLTDETIISGLKSGFGITVSALSFLPKGADADASVFRAQAENAAYFIKIKRGHTYDISAAILGLLEGKGVQEIVPPVKTIDGKMFRYVNDYTLVVYPYVEGLDGFNRHLSDAQWVSFGKALRQVHDLKVPTAIKTQIRHEEYSPKWRNMVHSLYTRIESQNDSDDWGQKLIKFMIAQSDTIHRLVNQSEQLSYKIKSSPDDFVLCHSDIHGGNVLLGEADSFFIVDWDDVIMAPKERDLMFIGAGVGNVWNKPSEEELFYKG